MESVFHLMQLCGSVSQSVLHRNLSQATQPMGGVLARPFSSASVDRREDQGKRISSRDRGTWRGIKKRRNLIL